MAEEKKTTTKTTTKSSTKAASPKKTTAKVKNEELKVEKRFCKNCGKELIGEEECVCGSKPEVVSVNTDALKGLGKGFLDTIINMYKKPATTLDEEVNKKDLTANMIMLVAIAISFGIYMMGGFESIMLGFNDYNLNIKQVIEIPYFKIFLYMTLIYFILSFIPITVAFVISKLTGNNSFDFKKSISLYATSMAPTIFTNILMALMYYLNILSWVGALIGFVITIACFFNYILGYIRNNTISENKKSYDLTTLVFISIIGYFIAFIIFAGSMFTDMSGDFNIKANNNNYNDLFNW